MADAQRGVAFFDGVRIEADRITNPRWTRVLPILEEEQVRMCRAMRQRGCFRPGLAVLDLGTGSGVMAIWAAIAGCRVIAVDISPRALRLAGYNIENNAASIATGGGTIDRIRMDARDFAADPANAARFDVVMLTPPYNPTAPGLHPARHASAGPDGMQVYREQLLLAGRMLRPDGLVIGNQMVLHDAGCADAWWADELARLGGAVGGDFEVAYASMLDEAECPAETFLRGQYKHHLDPRLGLTPGPEAVERYIQELLGPPDRPKAFALYYFEVRRAAPSRPRVQGFALPSLPHRGWSDRIKLHQTIVDHTSSQNTFQTPTLFLDNAYSLPFANDDAGSDLRPSALDPLPKWIAQAEIFTGDNPLDFLMIDAAPWYSTWEGRRGLHNDVHLYVRDGFLEEKGVDPAETLQRYQEAVANIQRLGQGPFLHPLFTGQRASDLTGRDRIQDWGLVYFRVIDGASAMPGVLDDAEALAWEILESDWRWEDVAPLSGPSAEPEITDWPGFKVCRTEANLAQLDTDPALAEDRLRRMQRRSAEAGLSAQVPELAQADLAILYMGYHARLRTLLKVGDDDSCTTALVALPLRLSALEAAPGDSQVPDSFRGGVFVFAGTRGRLTTEDESRLVDFVRLAVLLESAEIDIKAMQALRELVGRDYHSAFAHEIKTVIGGISPDMLESELEEIRAYFLMLSLYPEEFRRHDADAIWLDVQGAFPMQFAQGRTLQTFLTNHLGIALRLRRMLAVLASGGARLPPDPPLRWSDAADPDVSRDYAPTVELEPSLMGPAAPPKLLELCAFGAALVAAFRNLLDNQDIRHAEIEVSWTRERLCIRNHRPPEDSAKSIDQIKTGRTWSTGGVLEQLASRYGRRGAVQFGPDPDDRLKWRTVIPFPPGFLADESFPD